MKKITLRTKITLTIIWLLAMAGIFYAANPSQFATVPKPVAVPGAPMAFPTSFAPVPEPIGVAASTTDVFATEYETQNIDTIDCSGNVTVLATLPLVGTGGQEKYIAIAPSQSALAGFTPRDVFVTQGPNIYKISGGAVTLFALISSDQPDHTAITI